MTDNTREKEHLRRTESTLNDLTNINTVNSIIAKRSLDLFSTLSADKNLFVDDEIITDIADINTRLVAGGIVNKATIEITNINLEETGLTDPLLTTPQRNANQPRLSEIRSRRWQLLNITWGTNIAIWTWSNDLINRRREYAIINTYVNYFNRASKLPNIDVNLNLPIPRAGVTNINQSLHHNVAPDFLWFKLNVTDPDPTYTLCDENWLPLSQIGTNYTIQIGGQTATISGIDLTWWRLNLENIAISPTNINLSQPIKLSINWTYKNVTAPAIGGAPAIDTRINVVCNKKFELQLRNGPAPVPVDTPALRNGVVNDFNRRAPINTVTNEINNTYRNRFATFQRDSVFEALKHMDGARFAQLEEYGRKNGKEEEIKEELYQQIYREFLTTPVIAGPLGTINNYGNFSNWYTEDARDWNNDKAVTGSAQLYEQYLHNNLSTRVEEYMKDELNRLLKNNHTNNMRLKKELSTFLTSIEWRKNDEETNAGQTIQTATEADIGPNDLMKKHWKKKFLGISWGRDDDIYTKFLNGANHEVKDQTVDIATNTSPEDFKNIEPVKYDLKTEITGKNNISTTITFPKTDKRYARKEIILTQGEVSTLTKKILNCKDIGDFKVRTHIVYNMLVSMIKIAEKKNLSLRYRVDGTPNQRELVMDDKNIALYEWDDTGAKRRVNTLFDYNGFVTTNTFHNVIRGRENDPKSLQTAIDGLMGHFNYAMNEYHKQYRNATTSRLLKTKVSANSFWTSPIKTVMNLRTVRKFDFTAKAASDDGNQNVDINFEKNVITLKMGDIELKGKNLGKMLEYRKNKIRVFDGIERNIIFAFYDELVKKLRENSKINRGNYCVRDSLTQNIYTMDEDGKLHIITPEDPGDILHGKNARIVSKTELDDVDARWWRRGCSEAEIKEAFMNPCIMGRMIKVMNKKMLRM